jgi:nucleoside-diphosphate-sugar epimerase/predicted dehydrogenase
LVLGGGAVVRECFLPAIRMLGALERTTVVDTSDSVAEIGRRYPAVNVRCVDFRKYLAECPPEENKWAIVALPNAFHEDAVKLALSRKMHVLCEKPLTLDSLACRRLAEAALAARRVLAVNMVRRLYPSVAMARFAIARGLIGRIREVDLQHGSPYAWPAQSLAPFQTANGGVLADMGVHYLDLAEHLAGELTPREYLDDNRGGVEADVTYRLVSRDGAAVRIALSRLRTLANQVVLVGTCGRLELPVDNLTSCTLVENDGARIELRNASPFTAGDFAVDFAACFAQQLHDFSACVNSGATPHVDGFTAARTIEHIEWAYRNRAPAVTQAQTCASGIRPAPVLITGATGFLGSHLVEELSARGFSDITAAVRSPQNCAAVARFPLRLEPIDLLNFGQVRDAVRGKRYVFHLAYGRDGNRPRDITVEGTRNIVNAAIAEGCESVVIPSTIYVFGSPSGVVDESAVYRPIGGEYGRSKAVMERWCLDRAASSGNTRITILNPSCIYGPRGKTYSELPAMLARDRAFCWIADGLGNANYTFATNVVDAMLVAAIHPQAHGERFIINDGTVTWRAFLEPVLEPWLSEIRSYTKAELIRIEKRRRVRLLEAARTAARNPELRRLVRQTALGEWVAAARRRWPSILNGHTNMEPAPRLDAASQPPAPPSWLADLFSGGMPRFSAEKARRVLGWSPRLDLAEGQRRTIRYLEEMNLR